MIAYNARLLLGGLSENNVDADAHHFKTYNMRRLSLTRHAHQLTQSYGWCTWTWRWSWSGTSMLRMQANGRNTWVKWNITLSYLVGAGHCKYVCCLPQHQQAMRDMTTLSLAIIMAFNYGQFTVRHTEGRFNGVWRGMTFMNTYKCDINTKLFILTGVSRHSAPMEKTCELFQFWQQNQSNHDLSVSAYDQHDCLFPSVVLAKHHSLHRIAFFSVAWVKTKAPWFSLTVFRC